MANKFDVFVYKIGEEFEPSICDGDGNYSISADFVDMDGNITSCRIVDVNFKCGSSKEVLNIDDCSKEMSRESVERLLAADEFYIEVRYKTRYLGDDLAITYFTQILSHMVWVDYAGSETRIKGNRRDTPRNVERKDAPQEYWEERELKKLLSKLSEVSSKFETLCGESHVQQINLEGGQVDVSEVLTYLQTMRANIFDKLDSPEKQQTVA